MLKNTLRYSMIVLALGFAACEDSPTGPPANLVPTANAGPDQAVTDNDGGGTESVTLDGSASIDSDGTIVSWVWTENALEIGSGESPVVAFVVGVHTVTLTVTDDDGDINTDDVVITVTGNGLPIANAGPDQAVGDGDNSGDAMVSLDGSASIDSDGTIVSWVWTESAAEIATGATPAALAFAVGAHTVTLTVTDDGGVTDTDDVLITVTANLAPVANAGPDQGVTDNDGGGDEMVTLDGSASTDSDGTIVSWVWEESASQIATGETPAAMAFTVAGSPHTVTLTVTDNAGLTSTDDVIITANVLPTANAGPDQGVTDNDGGGTEMVTLDGSGSTDSDGTIVSYVWEEASSQIGTGVSPTLTFAVGVHTVESVTLDGSGSTDSDGTIVSYLWEEASSQIGTGVSPTLTFTVGVHTVTLTVTDDRSGTHSDDVIITVNLPPNQNPVANAG